MTTRTKPVAGSPLRAQLCSIENANRLAVQVADDVASDTAVVRTGNPDQPFRVVLANCVGDAQIVSRTVRCSQSAE
jgi:hypothetical protein